MAEDGELLRSLSVTHVLNVSSFPSSPFAGHIKYTHLPLLDVPEQELTQTLDQAFELLLSVRESRGCCLVHCNAGVPLCVSVVLAYLICVEGIPFDQALLQVSVFLLSRH